MNSFSRLEALEGQDGSRDISVVNRSSGCLGSLIGRAGFSSSFRLRQGPHGLGLSTVTPLGARPLEADIPLIVSDVFVSCFPADRGEYPCLLQPRTLELKREASRGNPNRLGVSEFAVFLDFVHVSHDPKVAAGRQAGTPWIETLPSRTSELLHWSVRQRQGSGRRERFTILSRHRELVQNSAIRKWS